MRPIRNYQILFKHPLYKEGMTYLAFHTRGPTPCAARNAAWTELEAYLKDNPDKPSNGWKVQDTIALN